MSLDGYINGWDGRFLRGWAFDSAEPAKPLDLELSLSNGLVLETRANLFREDLLRNGAGDGNHGFEVALPAVSASGSEDLEVQVRVKGSDFTLKGSPLRMPPALPFSLIAADIVNNCNLRCPFCMVDYNLIKGLKFMPDETFTKALELAPLVPDGGYWLSCLHEPTLHPRLVDFIEQVPAGLRKKFSFTTNFCKRLDDSALERLAASGIHSVRVSFDSMEPERFKKLRKGGLYEVFHDNLRRFSAFLRKSPNPPLLHLISMALRDNLDELPAMVLCGSDIYGAGVHEVRFMYYFPHIADWGREHMLTVAEWQVLERTIRALKPSAQLYFSQPEARVMEKFERNEGIEEYFSMEAPFGGSGDPMDIPLLPPEQAGLLAPDEPFRLRMRWDGMTIVEQIPEVKHRAYLPRLDAPAAYFHRMRFAAAKHAGNNS